MEGTVYSFFHYSTVPGWDRVSLCNPGSPQIHRSACVSASRVPVFPKVYALLSARVHPRYKSNLHSEKVQGRHTGFLQLLRGSWLGRCFLIQQWAASLHWWILNSRSCLSCSLSSKEPPAHQRQPRTVQGDTLSLCQHPPALRLKAHFLQLQLTQGSPLACSDNTSAPSSVWCISLCSTNIHI